jgi:NAD(P)-dependent dehydrogenase (short-subunit alcohol dehydrogenase family)
MDTINLFRLDGRIALVTGGSRGIGRMIAAGFIAQGATVYIAARKADACLAAAEEMGERCLALPQDVSTVEGCRALAGQLAQREERLDVLVNNAGAAWGEPIDEYSESGWDKVMNINLKGPFFVTQKLLPLLRKAGTDEDPARVINIASVNGIVPPELETYAYSSSKAGCIMLTRHLAGRLARENILVNAIAPGPFPSHMMRATLDAFGDQIKAGNPRKRIGTPEDIAGVAIFLSSRASAYTTGATIPCDGGSAEV